MRTGRHLVGRDTELDRLRRLAAEVAEHGSAVIVRGAPGVGKSALVETVADELAAAGWRVLRTSGTPSEQRLPLAALHKLLVPVLDGLAALPDAQREALRRAFGLTDAPAPGLSLVGLAALGLLGDAASGAPLLLLVEDAHWLDRDSAQVIGFIARRLESDALLLVATTRPVREDPLAGVGVPELSLAELAPEAAADLLQTTGPDLPRARRQVVLEAAAGNPLALVELPKELARLGEDADVATTLPMTTRLEQAFAARLADLPHPTKTLLLVAALNDSDRLAEILSACELLVDGPGLEDLHAAVDADLVVADGEALRFRHPLVRSAVARTATVAAGHAAHRALAQMLAGEPERQVWHRAACVLGSDETVAVAVEGAAARAERRGATDTAIMALRRAAQLSETSSARGRRLLRAAELTLDQGRIDVSRRLAGRAEAGELSRVDHLRAEALRQQAGVGVALSAGGVQALLTSAEEARALGDADLALGLLRIAAFRCWTVGVTAEVEARVVAAADRVPVDAADPRQIAIRAYAAPFAQGARVVELLERWPAGAGDAAGSHLLAQAAGCVGAFEQARELSAAAVAGLRREGRLVRLAQALRVQAWAEIRCSRWDVGLAAAEEGERLADETRQPLLQADALAARALVSGLRGDEAEAARLALSAEALALPARSNVTLATIQNGRAMTAAGGGRPAEAFEQLWRIYRPADSAYHRMQGCFAIGSLAEYAVQSGHEAQAAEALEQLESFAAATPSAGLHIGLRYARALLADPDEAGALFEAALGDDVGPWPFKDARVLLAYGGWLRRQRRVSESRVPLRAALSTFDRLGARGWSERARSELRAGGEGTVPRALVTRDSLTPQELQIARMVAEGLSNKEIGERLYLSHRTVASHLYRVYPKLGVTSRAQVLAALANVPGPE